VAQSFIKKFPVLYSRVNTFYCVNELSQPESLNPVEVLTRILVLLPFQDKPRKLFGRGLMIVGLFGGLVIFVIVLLMTNAEAFAINLWFVSMPMFIIFFVWACKRERWRQQKMTPEEKAQADRDLARFKTWNDNYKIIRKRERSSYKRR
jgi:hypothetical protein